MQNIITALRQSLGNPDFYIVGNNYSSTWDYGAMLEYFVAACFLLVGVSWAFRMIKWLFSR